MKLATLVLVFSVVVCSFQVTGCKSCSEAAVLATLKERQGQVDRDTRAKVREWSQADVGATFSVGDAVRTAAAATALLALDDGSQLRVRPKTVLRFSDSPPKAGEQGFDVETGEAMLEAGDQGLVLRTSLGLARIDGKSQVLVRRTTQGVRFEVHVGRAVLETKDGKKNQLKEGEGIIVGVGEAVIERVSLKPDEPPPAPPEPVVEEPELLQDVTGDVAGEVSGTGVSLKEPSAKAFTVLKAGAVQVPSGSTVKIKSGSSLSLKRGGATASLAGAGTYQIGGPDGALVQVQQGSVSLSGGRTRVIVPGGAIVTTPDSSAAIETQKKGTKVRVSQSHVSVEGAKGSERVEAGQEAVLGGDGTIQLEGRGLSYADIVVSSGESVVVHDPKPPTAIRIVFNGACKERGTVKVQSTRGNQFASGSGSVALPFAPGRHSYGLYCLEGEGVADTPVSQGSLTILHDAGTRPVPKKPPSTGVEADGRTYTVMYQNQLPAVSLRWSKAPPATSFTLTHRSPFGSKAYKTSSAAYSFRSGALPEGTHTFFFEGGGKVSRQTTVQIKFDNAAPTASLRTPVGPNVKQGEAITISGVAQPGWDVKINGKSAALDGQQRFSQKAEMPTDARALAVRLTHPQRGTHIYVRRAAGSND